MNHSILSDSAEKRDPVNAHAPESGASLQPFRLVPIEPIEFFEAIEVKHETAVHGLQYKRLNPSGERKWSRVEWHGRRAPFALWAARWAEEREDAYFSLGAFGDMLNEKGNRSRAGANAIAFRVLAIDVDVGDTHTSPGYEGGDGAKDAIEMFVTETGLVPQLAVATGTGGWHLYWVIDRLISPGEYKALGDGLKATAQAHGLKIDKSVGADRSQVMRAPGSINSKTGAVVQAYRWEVLE